MTVQSNEQTAANHASGITAAGLYLGMASSPTSDAPNVYSAAEAIRSDITQAFTKANEIGTALVNFVKDVSTVASSFTAMDSAIADKVNGQTEALAKMWYEEDKSPLKIATRSTAPTAVTQPLPGTETLAQINGYGYSPNFSPNPSLTGK